jgi:hypothetical protein
MRYMMIVKGDKNYEAGRMPDPRLLAAINELSEKQAKAGILVDNGGLLPSSHGARIRAAGGKLSVTDGPFTEAKELVGGFAIMLADSREEAIRLGREFMQLHVDILGKSYEGELEIRRMFEPSDFCGDTGQK